MGKKQNIGFDDFLNFILELHFHITKSLAALEVYFYDTYKFQIKDWQKLEIYLSIQSITSEAFTKLKELLYQDLANISLLRTSKEAIEKILNGLDYENVRDYGKKMSFDECYLDFQGIVDDLYNNYDCSEDSLANNIYHDSHYASLKYYEASRYGIRGLIILIDDIYNLKPHFKTEDIEYWRKIKGFVLPNLVEIQEFEEEYDVDLNKYRVRFQDFHGKPAIWEEEYNPHNEYNPHEEREFESEGTYDESTKDYELKDGGICPFGIHKAKLINFFNDSY